MHDGSKVIFKGEGVGKLSSIHTVITSDDEAGLDKIIADLKLTVPEGAVVKTGPEARADRLEAKAAQLQSRAAQLKAAKGIPAKVK